LKADEKENVIVEYKLEGGNLVMEGGAEAASPAKSPALSHKKSLRMQMTKTERLA